MNNKKRDRISKKRKPPQKLGLSMGDKINHITDLQSLGIHGKELMRCSKRFIDTFKNEG